MPWWIANAFADDPIDIPPVDPVPSALDSDPDASDAVEGKLRGRIFLRPQAGLATHDDLVAVRLGAALGHAWWTLGERVIQVGGETILSATAPAGGASGYRVDLGTRAGPWLGPVNLSVGPLARVESERWGRDQLPTALLLGGTVDLGLDFGPVGLTAGFQPLSGVAGDHRTELGERLGARATMGPLDVMVEGEVRQTAVGAVEEGSVGLRLRLR